MARQGWKAFGVAGLLGLTGLAAGCSDTTKSEVNSELREAGQQVGEAAKDVKESAKEAADGLRDGYGGSGTDKRIGDGKIGEHEGVINDGEGPFEQHDQTGKNNPLKDGTGPLENNH